MNQDINEIEVIDYEIVTPEKSFKNILKKCNYIRYLFVYLLK